jgi:nitrile hydratase beta subunit
MTASTAAYETHADLGGLADDRPVRAEPHEPPFHAAWEARALAVTLAMGATGTWNLDMSRAARETLPDYADLDYYRIWLAALERLIVAHGLATADELQAGRALQPPRGVTHVLQAADVAPALARGSPTERAPSGPPRFTVGDAVRARALAVAHHTRLPAYARGKLGHVQHVHGAHVFADAHAQGLGETPQWLYTVAFDARELWGDGAAVGCAVSIDAWEPYLEPAAPSRR